MKIVLHSYSFRTYSLEAAFVNAQRFGWDGLELFLSDFDREHVEDDLPRCVALGGAYAMPIHCVDFWGDFINDDSRRVEESVRQTEREISACAQNGISLLNGAAGTLAGDPDDYQRNGSVRARDVHYDRATEALRHLGAVAARHGIRLSLETHMNTLHDTLTSLTRLLDRVGLDNVQACPDPANLFCIDATPRDPEALDMLAGRIGHFHTKNCTGLGGHFSFHTKLADGEIDLFQYIQKLADLGYDGGLCVDYCGQGDPHVVAEQDATYLRRCLDRLATS